MVIKRRVYDFGVWYITPCLQVWHYYGDLQFEPRLYCAIAVDEPPSDYKVYDDINT